MTNLHTSAQIVEPNWLARPSIEVAPDLVGCTLVRQLSDRTLVRGMIVETEAYGPGDPACHAYRRQTERNRVMFGPAGYTYVYIIYGIYHCLNLVTDQDGVPSAVLLRALLLESIPSWTPHDKLKPQRVAAGPGKLCNVLQIDRSLNAHPLKLGAALWVEHRHPQFAPDLIQTTRIGLTQGADLPWRWYWQNCPAVSRF